MSDDGPFEIELVEAPGTEWDVQAAGLEGAGLFHRAGWLQLWREVYGQRSVGLLARRGGAVCGLLPLVRKKSRLFGRYWVSMPYFDACAAAGSASASLPLLERSLQLARECGDEYVEVRCHAARPWEWACRTHKVHVVLDLPGTREAVPQSFKAKLRSQVNRARCEDVVVECAGAELVQEFWEVYTRKMRDLGSPGHSLRLFRRLVGLFPDEADVLVVRLGGRCVSGAVLLQDRDTVVIPWAATLSEVTPLSLNMLLYFEALGRAVDRGATRFDFGRTDADSAHLRFKLQWGGAAQPLHWYRAATGGGPPPWDVKQSARLKPAARVWRKLPLAVTRFMGPRLVKHFS